jgi:hypothetical protein
VAVEASLDGEAWRETSRLAVARPLVEAILRDPRDATFTVDFAPTQVRYVRIRQLRTSKLPWAVAKVEVLAAQ